MAGDIQGTPGNDTLYGTSGDDTFDGKGGNDIEVGIGGNDTFIFNAGYGRLEIDETSYAAGMTSVLKLGPEINESSVTVTGSCLRAALTCERGGSACKMSRSPTASSSVFFMLILRSLLISPASNRKRVGRSNDDQWWQPDCTPDQDCD